MSANWKAVRHWFAAGVCITAAMYALYLLALAIGKDTAVHLSWRAFSITYIVFGLPFAISALCEAVLPEVFQNKEGLCIFAGLGSVWGTGLVKMVLDTTSWAVCAVIAVALTAFIIHYKRLKKKAEGK